MADWQSSRQAVTTPAAALAKPALERRVSNPGIPGIVSAVAVGCYECHSCNLSAHKDAFHHMGTRISVVVSPADCKVCHLTEVQQFAGSKKAHAVDNLHRNAVYSMLVRTATGRREVKGDRLMTRPPSPHTRAGTCYACHGAVVRVRGVRKVESDPGQVEVPDLSGWPSRGVGRVNPDGTRGA